MDDCEKSDKKLPEKEDFHSHMENIAGEDYTNTKRVCKNFEIKNLDGYHDLYVQSNILLPADVLENFRNIFLEIYKSSAQFLTSPR